MTRKSTRVFPFSEKTITSLILPLGDRVDWWDATCPQLTIRVSKSGDKVFYWAGREKGDYKRIRIGTWPTVNVNGARTEAKRISGEVAYGREAVSVVKRKRIEWTLLELFNWYFEKFSKPHKRTWKWDKRNYETSISHWANRRVSSITKNELMELHLDIGEKRGKYAANKMLELVRVMYRKGNDFFPNSVTVYDPTRGVPRFPTDERERFLDSDELPKFLAAVNKLPGKLESRDFLLLALFTGARRGNVLSMKWEDLSVTTGVWIVGKDSSKNKKPMRISLSPPAIEILKRRRKIVKGPWVLPGRGVEGHYNCPKNAMKNALQISGLKDVRIHDLRRTLGSWVAINYPIQTVAKLLGHRSVRSAQVYAKLADKSLKEAVSSATGSMDIFVKAHQEAEDLKAKANKRKK